MHISFPIPAIGTDSGHDLQYRKYRTQLLLLLFLTFSVLVANPKKLLYTVANPARGLLIREKRNARKSLAVSSIRTWLIRYRSVIALVGTQKTITVLLAHPLPEGLQQVLPTTNKVDESMGLQHPLLELP